MTSIKAVTRSTAIVNDRGFTLHPVECEYNAHGQRYIVNYFEGDKQVGHTLRPFSYSDVLGIIHRWIVEGVQTC